MKIVDLVAEKGAASVPMHLQIKAGHMLYKAKNKLGMYTKFPEFTETPVPEVSDLAIDDIDVSNPFLFKQNRWESYFKRLRDECPVHYQKKSPFGPFWSITRYEDIAGCCST